MTNYKDDDQVLSKRAGERLIELKADQMAKKVLAAEKRAGQPGLDVTTLGDLLARPEEPPARIEGLMPWSASTTVIAPRKTGKTTLIGNLAKSLQEGGDFLGKYPVLPLDKTEKVAIMNFEVSGAQIGRWCRDMMLDLDRTIIVNLRGRTNPFTDAVVLSELGAQLKALNTKSLIVDPFSKAYTGSDQNSAGEISEWLGKLDVFARQDVGALDLILTVHAGWKSDHSRGSSALEDWPDGLWTLTRPDKNMSARFFSADGRDVNVPEDLLHYDDATRLLSLTGTGDRKVAAFAVTVSIIRYDIRMLLSRTPEGLNTRALLNSPIHGTKDQRNEALRQMVEEGEVTMTVRTGRGGGHIFTLTPPEDDDLLTVEL